MPTPPAKPRTPARTPARKAAPAPAAATPPAPAPVAAKAAKPAKPAKPPKKPKPELVRDGFTMPAPDFALIAQLKTTAMGAGREAKKSELLRAGLRALAALDGKALVKALNQLEPVKIGRPKKGH